MENRFKKLEIEDVYVFTPRKFSDDRGVFFENFNYLDFNTTSGHKIDVVQENISISKKNVIRGMHFQRENFAQSKLVSVVKGKIFDVMVDIRNDSKTFGCWISYFLDAKDSESIFIPSGFAHGFLALEEETVISYKVDKPYKRDYECCLLWNDKSINIEWPVTKPLLSSKDIKGHTFTNLKNCKLI